MDSSEQPARSILIIEDELPILNLLTRTLTRHGYRVDAVACGQKGIEKLNSNEYSAILTDMIMPGVSGEQVLYYLKHVLKDSTPIIGTSGTPWLLENSAFDSVLPKPYTMKELMETIQSLTGHF
ncbi:MAG: response regulator [Desulfobacteraceae bacterium]|nr:MAG: response regulator [Desulfobacteraceae bacterium]